MVAEELKLRTKKFAVKTILFFEAVEFTSGYLKIVSNQLIRSATSVGANYRAACRARSQAEFISRIKVVEEEADESVYWIEILEETGCSNLEMLVELKQEAKELTAIFSASAKTAKANNEKNIDRGRFHHGTTHLLNKRSKRQSGCI